MLTLGFVFLLFVITLGCWVSLVVLFSKCSLNGGFGRSVAHYLLFCLDKCCVLMLELLL